jgi:hypothetical protein
MLWLTWALPLGLALSGESSARSVRAHAGRDGGSVRAHGNHQVEALIGVQGGELGLKLGFVVRPRVAAQRAPQRLTLRVAAERAPVERIAPGFVPIGPTVELKGDVLHSDVEYRAESFRVRSGHRLVLALETRAPCAPDEACWTTLEARLTESRCVAHGVRSAGQRLQFGSLPLSAP